LLWLLISLGFPGKQDPGDFCGVPVLDATCNQQPAKLDFAVRICAPQVSRQSLLLYASAVAQASQAAFYHCYFLLCCPFHFCPFLRRA
jgi:hypothetical protein